ncbi:hypothetical protein ROZALSC1DRAFT_31364, partial [Rozella allomycis CSF55]
HEECKSVSSIDLLLNGNAKYHGESSKEQEVFADEYLPNPLCRENAGRCPEYTQIYDMIIDMIDHNENLKNSLLDDLQIKHELMQTKFNGDDDKHVSLLKELWSTLFPENPDIDHVSEHWKFLGFQNHSPATDFRGMGLLGLTNLLYCAQNYTEAIRGIIIHDDLHYPWAATGINVTAYLVKLQSIQINGLL